MLARMTRVNVAIKDSASATVGKIVCAVFHWETGNNLSFIAKCTVKMCP